MLSAKQIEEHVPATKMTEYVLSYFASNLVQRNAMLTDLLLKVPNVV